MKRKNNLKITLGALFIITLLSSCLKEGLPKYPAFGTNNIDKVYVEYRWQDSTNMYNGKPVVAYQGLTVISQQIDSVNNVINISLAVPAPNASFTNSQRKNVNQNNLWLSFDISTAATITSAPGTPKPGFATDLTKPQSYVVTAANGKSRTWKVVVAPLPIINKYEGNYNETGYFTHPSSPRALSMTKYLSSIDANTVSCDLADLGSSGYTMQVQVAPDNSCSVTVFVNGAPYGTAGGASGNQVGKTNQYFPATKTFILNYQYNFGTRSITDTLRAQ
jgi:hypothetical protein